MKNKDGINKELSTIYIYVASAIVVWTIGLGASLMWNIHGTKKATGELAKKEARIHFNKDQAFRLWGAKHGGVYVPATENTPPNPNLAHIPERDIKTPSGKHLTLMNPAYMIRQMMNEFSELYGVKGRITSLKPLYPPNAPDEWEAKALRAFEKGVKEVFEFTEIEGEPYLRLMRPMITQKPCLKCHAFQGYKEGDIRGGVGVSVPMRPYWAVQQKTINTLITAHFLIWIFGLAVIGFISVKARAHAFERIEAEDAIRRSEDNLNRAQEVAHIGSWYLDIPKNELLWSKETYRIFGVPFDTILTYEAFLQMVYPDDRSYVDRSWKAALSGEPYDIQHRIVVNGMVKWVREKAELVFNEKGEPLSGIGTVQDITDLKKAEEVIRRSKEFNETILNSMKDSIIVIDVVDYKIISANNAFLKLYQLGEKDVIGKTCYEITHHIEKPCDLPDHPCPMAESLKGSGHTTYEHMHFGSDGSKRYVEVTTAPIRDAGGNIIQVVHSERDVTERKRLEEQLRQAQKMEAIGLLAGGVAHDFNNILTAIIGYGNLLRANIKDDNPLSPYVDQILSSGEKAANLTQSLLAFSRKQILSPKPVNLNDIVKRMQKFLLRLIGEDIELKAILSKNDLIVMADSSQIEQVIMNLCTNARDAMPDGGAITLETSVIDVDEVYAKARLFEKTGRYAVISISDTGIGMDETTRERIFEPFFTTKELGRGTGLGLSIVYGIIKQHNGYINVYSEVGRGTTFKIYLPLMTTRLKETEKEVLPPPKGGTEAILVAEDDREVREFIKEVFTAAGYKVKEAVDGEDAVNVFAENKDEIQLLLFDVIMPKMNGKAAYEEINKIKPGIKALFMSGYTADIVGRKGALEQGVNFISKPVIPDELLRKAREILDG
jgi:two-component system cell cycle sensor histidine kinase/response regulator CckA